MSRAAQTKSRYSQDDWSQLMAEYEASELTQRQFCEHHQLAYSTFATGESACQQALCVLSWRRRQSRCLSYPCCRCAGSRTGAWSWKWATAWSCG